MMRLISASSRSFFISTSLLSTAALIMRMTSIRSWSRAFMASLRSSVKRSRRDITEPRGVGCAGCEDNPSLRSSQSRSREEWQAVELRGIGEYDAAWCWSDVTRRTYDGGLQEKYANLEEWRRGPSDDGTLCNRGRLLQ